MSRSRGTKRMTEQDLRAMTEYFIRNYIAEARYIDVQSICGLGEVDEILDMLDNCRIEVKWKSSSNPSSNPSRKSTSS